MLDRASNTDEMLPVHGSKWISAKGNEPVADVAVRSLRSRLEVVIGLLPLAAKTEPDEGIEYVHLLRVWTRRTDAAINTYHELLSEWRAVWIQKQLKRIRKATNAARDDDVLIMRLQNDETRVGGKLLQRLRKDRLAAQTEVVEIYKRLSRRDGRFRRRVDSLLKRVRLRGKRRDQHFTFADWARARLRPLVNDLFAMAEGDLTDTESLHHLRIQGKKLRYAIELLSSAFEGDRLRQQAYPMAEELQDHLGEINDHASAVVRFGNLLKETEGSKRARHLQQMLEDEEQQLKQSQRRFSVWWSEEKLHRFRDVFDEVLGPDGSEDPAG